MDRKCPDFPDKEHYVGRVFADIAPVYDKANLLMSLGFLKNWQKFLINKTAFKPGQKALDIGTGTGELAFLLAEKAEHRGEVVALDISPEMLAIAKKKSQERGLSPCVEFIEGSALELPFADNSFDLAVSGFALRNVKDLAQSLREMQRILVPGGKMLCMEVARPANPLFAWGFDIYFGRLIPLTGKIFGKGQSIEGRQAAYTWLRDSFIGFPYGQAMVDLLLEAGFAEAEFFPLTQGAVNIYLAKKASVE